MPGLRSPCSPLSTMPPPRTVPQRRLLGEQTKEKKTRKTTLKPSGATPMWPENRLASWAGLLHPQAGGARQEGL